MYADVMVPSVLLGSGQRSKSITIVKMTSWLKVDLNTLVFCLFFTGISNAEARQPGKAPNFSVNWAVGDQGLEVINATTGKDDLGRPSRLCKQALHSRWMRLHTRVISIANAFATWANPANDATFRSSKHKGNKKKKKNGNYTKGLV